MKKLFFSLCVFALLSLSSCDKYDDGPLSNRVDNLENRVKSLEEQCKQLNANVSSIQTLVDALKDHDVITSVTPLVEGDKEVGYSFAFSKSPSISVYHGSNGASPSIGIKKDSDGNYYWTLDGEWLLDDDGNKILSNGTSGAALPEFKIDNDNWHLSLDGGETWVNLGQGTTNGQGTNIIFNDIDTTDPDKVTFTLPDGTKFEIPRQAELTISFDKDELSEVNPNTTYTIGYVVEGKTDRLKLEILSSGNVRAKLNNLNSAKGTITIITGETIDEYDKVIMLASYGSTTVMSSISFVKGDYLQVTSGTTYQIPATGGTVSINLETNSEYSLSIPNSAKEWIKSADSRSVRQETIKLTISANEGVDRSAIIQFVDKSGNIFTSIEISQEGVSDIPVSIPSDMELAFPDNTFRSYVLSRYDRNHDKVISEEEALNVTSISVYDENIFSLEGIQYFQNLDNLSCSKNNIRNLDVSKNKALKNLDCSDNQLTSLNVINCKALKSIFCNNNMLTNLDISNCTALTNLVLDNNRLSSLDVSNCKDLEYLSCSKNQLSSLDLHNCTHLTTLFCLNNQLKSIDVSNCTYLTKLSCYNNQLENLDVSDCIALAELECSYNLLTSLDVSKTNLGKSTSFHPLGCAMPTLKTLYLKNGWKISGINSSSSSLYINPDTEIKYVD